MQFANDPNAFGVDTMPNPPSESERESLAGDDSASELSSVGVARQSSGGRPPARPLRRGLRKLVLAAVVVGAAVALKPRRK
jgi:hypothetical protein